MENLWKRKHLVKDLKKELTEVLRGKDKELIEIIRNRTDWKTLALKVKAMGSPLHWGSL